MPVTQMRITEKKDSITFDGADKYFIPEIFMKYALYKLSYVFHLSYNEAMSMWKSNSPTQIIKVLKQALTKEQREGKF